MRKFIWTGLALSLLFAACSKEEQAPLPDLPKVSMPEGVVGNYSGRLPCENCKSLMAKMALLEDSSAVVVQTLFAETTTTDTLKGTFSCEPGKVLVTLGEGKKLNFQVGKSGALSLLTGAGTVYEFSDGMPADFIRILKQPKTEKTAKEPANEG